MQFHHDGLDHLSLDASAVTIGSFDGVHLGHQILMNQLIQTARRNAVPSVVVTFFPHPIVVLRGIQEPYYLTLPEERAGILHRLGIDHVVTIPFTRELSSKSPYEFMAWLQGHLSIRYLLIGPDFALGKDRQGNSDTLQEIGQTLGYQVEIVPFKADLNGRISSSRIRSSLKAGEVETANQLLGRLYTIPVSLSGGQAFDTEQSEYRLSRVNLECDRMQLLPAAGLYNARLDKDAARNFPLLIRAEGDSAAPSLTAWMSSADRGLLSTERNACLAILSRLDSISDDLPGLDRNDPLLADLIHHTHGG